MNPSAITLLLHVGSLISTFKALEQTVSDAVKGQNVSADLKAALGDVLNLITAGVINVPGLTPAQIQQVISDITAAL